MTAQNDAHIDPSQSGAAEPAYLRAIVETQNDIAAIELEPQRVMEIVVQRGTLITGADGAMVEWLDGGQATCRAVAGTAVVYEGVRFDLAGTASQRAIETGQAQNVTDTETDPRVNRERCRQANARSLVAVPLFQRGKAVGVLKVMSRRASAFTAEHVSALRLMAGLLAGGMAHAWEFEAKRLLLAERTAALSTAREANQRLRDSEERFRSAFDHAAIGMALVSLEGRFLQVNRSLCNIVGYWEAELLARDFQSITHPDDLDADLAFVRQLVGGQIPDYQMVKRYVHRQGRLVWIMLSVSLVRDIAGTPLYFIAQIQDITGRKQAEDALRASEEEFRATFELAGVGKMQTDLEAGRFIRVNEKFCQITGYSADELRCLTFAQISHPEDAIIGREALARMARGELGEYSAEKRYVRKDGRVIWVGLNAAVLRGAGGVPVRAVATVLDITARKKSEWLERDRRQVLEMVAQDLPLPDVLGHIAVAIERQMDGVAAVMAIRDGAVDLQGPNLPAELKQAIAGKPLSLAAALSQDIWDSPGRCRAIDLRSDDELKDLSRLCAPHGLAYCWAVGIRATDQTPLGLLTIFCRQPRHPTTAELQTLDMAAKLATICVEHHNTTRQLAHLVRHDPLTGLPNRICLEDRLQQATILARRNGTRVALFVMDVDRFKQINDTLGHEAGDRVLQQFAARLKNQLRESDTLARMGGDEFMLVLPIPDGIAGAKTVAQKLMACLNEPFRIGDGDVYVTSSIGVAIYPDDAEDSAALQRFADQEMYRVKQKGRNGYSITAARKDESAGLQSAG